MKNENDCTNSFKSLVGRRNDSIVLPDGSLLDPQSAVFQFETIPGIMEFQILQNDKRYLEVNVVARKNSNIRGTSETIRSNLHTVIPERVDVNVNVVTRLDRTVTGKVRSVRSAVLP